MSGVVCKMKHESDSCIFKWQPAATKLVTHTVKLNAGNPTDSLETRSIKVLNKNSLLSPEIWPWKNKRKLSTVLFYGGVANCAPPQKSVPPKKKAEVPQPSPRYRRLWNFGEIFLAKFPKTDTINNLIAKWRLKLLLYCNKTYIAFLF